MKNLKIFALVVVALTTSYCTKDSSEDLPQDQSQQQEVSPEILSKLESMGFDIKKKVPRVFEDKIVVEGDILLDKKTILEQQDQKQVYTRLVNCTNVRNIRVRNLIGNTAAGRSVQAGLNLWNNVRNSTLRFVLVNRPPYDITITSDASIGNFFAFASFPSNGRAGSTIRVNENIGASNGLTQFQYSRLITHEIGHCIGFFHSREEFLGTHVPGTIFNDRNSIMDDTRFEVYRNARDISRDDKIAVERMYSNRRDRLCR